jgi:transcription elongation GreA/GreB family factor
MHAADALTIDPTKRLEKENQELRMRQNAESEALWKRQREQDARIKTLEDWLRTAGLMDSCD